MKMVHPDIDAIADVVNHEGFNAVWAPRGWVLLDAPEAYASESLGKPVKKLDDLKVDELRGLVATRGEEYPGAKVLKEDVLKTYRDTFAEAEQVETPAVAGVEPVPSEQPVVVTPTPVAPPAPRPTPPSNSQN